MRKMGLPLTGLRPSLTHFDGIVRGKKVEPLGQISLEVVFSKVDNFWDETLCFEVVPFKGGYQALLGHPAFVKFMATPCYSYMKLKMPSPNGVIMVSGDTKNALEAEEANLELAKAELANFGMMEVSITTDEATPAAQKKALPSSDEQETRVAPTDPSSSNSMTSAGLG